MWQDMPVGWADWRIYMHYLAMGPHCWGQAETREQAVKNAKQNWPRNFCKVKRPSDKHFSIYTSDGRFSVDGMGYIRSEGTEITKIQTSILAKED